MAHKILVVDDELQIHTFIRISLVAEGLEYCGAHSIAEALDVLKQGGIDAVVLDLGLPDGDGIRLLEYLRSQSRTPVLILTARDEEDEKYVCWKQGQTTI